MTDAELEAELTAIEKEYAIEKELKLEDVFNDKRRLMEDFFFYIVNRDGVPRGKGVWDFPWYMQKKLSVKLFTSMQSKRFRILRPYHAFCQGCQEFWQDIKVRVKSGEIDRSNLRHHWDRQTREACAFGENGEALCDQCNDWRYGDFPEDDFGW